MRTGTFTSPKLIEPLQISLRSASVCPAKTPGETPAAHKSVAFGHCGRRCVAAPLLFTFLPERISLFVILGATFGLVLWLLRGRTPSCMEQVESVLRTELG